MRIAILGGGVAGVSCAIALRQHGFDVSVYERHDGPSHIGAGIVAWPNATFVLARLGVLADIQAVAGRPRRMRRRTPQSGDLGVLDIGLIDDRMAYPSLSILRRDFQRILIARLAALGVAIDYGRTVSHVDTGVPGQAVVHLQDGETVAADLIIGADGRMASMARRFVAGHNTPVYQRFVNWIGVCESPDVSFDVDEIADYWGIGERFGIVPVSAHVAYWAGGAVADAVGARAPASYRHELDARFGTWPAPVRAVIAHTPPERINKIWVHDHDPIAVWHRDNVILVGDAAHAALPTSGQGACQALEDAWHLADCLVRDPGDVPRALRTFTGIRLGKTTNITRGGRALAASIFGADGATYQERDRISRHTDFAAAAEAMAAGWGQGLLLHG